MNYLGNRWRKVIYTNINDIKLFSLFSSHYLATSDNFGLATIFDVSSLLCENVNNIVASDLIPLIRQEISSNFLSTFNVLPPLLFFGGLDHLSIWKLSNTPLKLEYLSSSPVSGYIHSIELLNDDCIIILRKSEGISCIDLTSSTEIFKINNLESEEFLSVGICPNKNVLVTGSDKGTISIWDIRSKTLASKFVPNDNDALKRVGMSPAILTLDVESNGEWCVCGGGPMLSVWHLPSGKLLSSLEDYSNTQYIPAKVKLTEDGILSVGSDGKLHTWKLDGTPSMCQNLSPPCGTSLYEYYAQDQLKSLKLLATCGRSNYFDVFVGNSLSPITLSLYPNFSY